MTREELKLAQVESDFRNTYEWAKKQEFINKPIAYALYETWKSGTERIRRIKLFMVLKSCHNKGIKY